MPDAGRPKAILCYCLEVRKRALFLAVLTGACTGPEAAILDSGETSYLFPGSHIRSTSGDDYSFVRVKPPGLRFELVHDSRIAGRRDEEDWPLVFSLNQKGKPNVDRHMVGEMKVVCRRAVNPRSGCGIEVVHRGTVWNALFPRKDKVQARKIEREALALLDSYSQ
jgi:hypothetical protein